MPKRPVIIIIIALCYFFSPFAIIVQGSIISNIPLFGPQNIFTRLFLTDIIILFIYPICAVALFSVKKWGWYLFLGCSLILITYNIVVYSLNPLYNLLILITFNIVLAVIAGIFFRKHVIAPYFNPRLRWWETDPRYKLDISAEIVTHYKKLVGEIHDISASGCLVLLNYKIRLGMTHKLLIRCLNHLVEINGKIMRKSSSDEEYDRYGIMFVKMTTENKYQLNILIEDLEKSGVRDFMREKKTKKAKSAEKREATRIWETAQRYALTHSAVLEDNEQIIRSQVLDISKHGCFIKSENDIPVGTEYTLIIQLLNHELHMKGLIEWKSDYHGHDGYGVKFVDLTAHERREIDKLIHTIKELGARNRLTEVHQVEEEVFDRSVANTPYKIVLFFKKLLLKDVR